MVWNEQYKQYPQTENNPGYGADSIRDLKLNLEEKFTAEHKFNLNDMKMNLP